MLQICVDHFAEKPSGLFTLSILRYVLKHASHEGKKHLIFIVPFTTIIKQSVAEVCNILMDDGNILEHHSSVIDDEQDDDEDQSGYAYA